MRSAALVIERTPAKTEVGSAAATGATSRPSITSPANSNRTCAPGGDAPDATNVGAGAGPRPTQAPATSAVARTAPVTIRLGARSRFIRGTDLEGHPRVAGVGVEGVLRAGASVQAVAGLAVSGEDAAVVAGAGEHDVDRAERVRVMLHTPSAEVPVVPGVVIHVVTVPSAGRDVVVPSPPYRPSAAGPPKRRSFPVPPKIDSARAHPARRPRQRTR